VKLLLENWRKYLNEEWSEEYMDLLANHNLFVDYIKNELVDDENPEVIKYLKSYSSGSGFLDSMSVNMRHRRAVELMDQEYKWGFPHDVDPSMNCEEKIEYLDKLVQSFLVHPELYNTIEKPGGEPLREKTDGPSPYQQCRSDAAEEKELRDKTSQEMQKIPGRAWYKKMQSDK